MMNLVTINRGPSGIAGNVRFDPYFNEALTHRNPP